MAIAPTGAMYKALKFDGVSSRTYGVYITGEAVYNAPERDVEMITIPGRNGSFALDNGRFENIEVSYPAGIFAETEADFRQAISDFRNFLCSRKGYVRLQDEYNPNEYRMAVYKSGLEVDPAQLRAGEFEITFDCKPQRYLTSGEEAIEVESGDTITNPTLFESSPLLEVEGYGTIEFNGYEIDLEDAIVGEVEVLSQRTIETNSAEVGRTMKDTGLLNEGDIISYSLNLKIPVCGLRQSGYKSTEISQITSITNSLTGVTSSFEFKRSTYGYSQKYAVITQNYPTLEFEYGTALTYTNKAVIVGSVISLPQSTGAAFSHQYVRVRISYDGDKTITLILNYGTENNEAQYIMIARGTGFDQTEITTSGIADSTRDLLGHPTYIDCDMGEAYRIEDGTVISLNQYIDLGSDLPKLASGENEVTFDNTITELQIVPRWWKI